MCLLSEQTPVLKAHALQFLDANEPKNCSPVSKPVSKSEPTEAGDRSDLPGYIVAVVILVGAGSVLRTPILNWISGPAIVIASVVLVGQLSDRRTAKVRARQSVTNSGPNTDAGHAGNQDNASNQ